MTIQEIKIKYWTGSNYITLHAVKEMDDYTVTIKDAYMIVTDNTSDEVKRMIDGFVSLVTGKAKADAEPKKIRKAPKQRGTRTLFNDEQKAEIIKRYQAGEGPKAIAKSLGVARSTIGNIIRKAGVVEGRTGAHLNNKPKPEPQPEDQEEQPV